MNNGSSSWLQIQTWEGNWTATGGGNANNNYAYPDHLDIQKDCDLGASSGTPDYGTWNGCPMMPRYRHLETSNFLFADGHVKSMRKGSVNFYKNIYVEGAYQHGGIY